MSTGPMDTTSGKGNSWFWLTVIDFSLTSQTSANLVYLVILACILVTCFSVQRCARRHAEFQADASLICCCDATQKMRHWRQFVCVRWNALLSRLLCRYVATQIKAKLGHDVTVWAQITHLQADVMTQFFLCRYAAFLSLPGPGCSRHGQLLLVVKVRTKMYK